MDLKISEEYKEIVPTLRTEEYNALKESLISEGQLYPVIANSKGTILDGMNRHEILTGLGEKTNYEVRDFPTKEAEKKFVLEVNLKRRHLNDFQKAEMGMALLEVERELAKQRKTLGTKVPMVEKGKTIEKVAQKIGINYKTFERAKKVIEEAPEKVKELCRTETLRIAPAFGLVKAFKGVPEAIKKTLVKQLDEGKMETKEIVHAIASTKAVKAQLEGEESDVKSKAEALFKDQFYTKELDTKSAIWQIDEISGDPHRLVSREFPLDQFISFDKAQEWAVKRDGVCEGKIEKWKIKFDPLKNKQIEAEEEKDES